MDNQTRNRLNLQKHAEDQAAIIRLRNAQIAALQAEKGRLQRALQERPDTPSEALIERAERAEGDLARYRAMHSEQIKTIARLQENPRPLTADINDEMIERARWFNEHLSPETIREVLTAALTEPTRPEEKVELVLRRYWSGDINGDDLADRIVEEMNR